MPKTVRCSALRTDCTRHIDLHGFPWKFHACPGRWQHMMGHAAETPVVPSNTR
jgi:hypothetical protein